MLKSSPGLGSFELTFPGYPAVSIESASKAAASMLEKFQTVRVDSNTVYVTPANLQFLKKVGAGAYGCVCAFKDTSNECEVAVKQIPQAFKDLVDAKRILREIKILRQLNHTNVVRILDIIPPPSPDFNDIYIINELMETDLHKVIYSRQDLTDEHHQYFLYQILNGLHYIHSANILHRDLKPSNILLNLNCDLKICDFGLSRGIRSAGPTDDHLYKQGDASSAGAFFSEAPLTDYVVTRWYRAPELILDSETYDKPVDVWSVGCIFAEILGRKALFAGKDHLDQLQQIIATLGSPTEADLTWLSRRGPGQSARRFLDSLKKRKRVSFEHIYPDANPLALDLLSKMLVFDPRNRVTVEEALKHPYFDSIASDEDLEACSYRDVPLNWVFEHIRPTKRTLQSMIYQEMALYQPLIIIRDLPKIGHNSSVLITDDALTRLDLERLVSRAIRYGEKKSRMNNNLKSKEEEILVERTNSSASSWLRSTTQSTTAALSECPGYETSTECCSSDEKDINGQQVTFRASDPARRRGPQPAPLSGKGRNPSRNNFTPEKRMNSLGRRKH